MPAGPTPFSTKRTTRFSPGYQRRRRDGGDAVLAGGCRRFRGTDSRFHRPDLEYPFPLATLAQDLSEATPQALRCCRRQSSSKSSFDRTPTPALVWIRPSRVRDDRRSHRRVGALPGWLAVCARVEATSPDVIGRDIVQKALAVAAGWDLNQFGGGDRALSPLRWLHCRPATCIEWLRTGLRYMSHRRQPVIHGRRFGLTATDDMFQSAEQHFAETGLAHAYASEDLAEIPMAIPRGGGQPPILSSGDAALNAAYRARKCSARLYRAELALTGAMARRMAKSPPTLFAKRDMRSRSCRGWTWSTPREPTSPVTARRLLRHRALGGRSGARVMASRASPNSFGRSGAGAGVVQDQSGGSSAPVLRANMAISTPVPANGRPSRQIDPGTRRPLSRGRQCPPVA